jgi:5-methylcytosine-specific restriction protein A
MKPITERHQVATVERWGNGRGGRPWRRLRDLVLVRDGYRCCECGTIKVAGMEVDHVVPVSRGGTDDLDNLRAMCAPCHRHKTARESRGR